MSPIKLTDENFDEEVIKSDKPVIVDFWATWCGPCKIIAPTIEELAKEYGGKVKVGKLDVDHNQEASIKYGVRSIPTVLFFQNGEVKDTIIGAMPKGAFVEKTDSLLAQV